MVKAEQSIWGELLQVSRFGTLRWRPDIDMQTGGDPRNMPERYMAMCGNLRPLHDFNINLSTQDLEPTTPHEYIATKGEITGTQGLLRLIPHFPITLPQPKDLLLVGAISPNSLFSTLRFLQSKGWESTHVALVDKSPIPLETLNQMLHGGYFSWPGGVDLMEGDVTQIELPNRPQVVISDILSTWIVDKFSYPGLDETSPYLKYGDYLKWAESVVGRSGWFFNRCMISAEDELYEDPNKRMAITAQKRADRILTQLGAMAPLVDREWLEDSVTELFAKVLPETFCGLERVSATFRAHPNLAGDEAENILVKLQRSTFSETHTLKVTDNHTGHRFLSFASRGSK